jgi:hypothetical protein
MRHGTRIATAREEREARRRQGRQGRQAEIGRRRVTCHVSINSPLPPSREPHCAWHWQAWEAEALRARHVRTAWRGTVRSLARPSRCAAPRCTHSPFSVFFSSSVPSPCPLPPPPPPPPPPLPPFPSLPLSPSCWAHDGQARTKKPVGHRHNTQTQSRDNEQVNASSSRLSVGARPSPCLQWAAKKSLSHTASDSLEGGHHAAGGWKHSAVDIQGGTGMTRSLGST